MNHKEWVKLAELSSEDIGPREEDVKFKLVAPMLRLLGFTDLDFSFETPANLGRIDITVRAFRVGVIVECKGPRIRLENHVSQVEKYVRETMTRQHDAMLSLLTNGERFKLYGVLGAIHKDELVDHLLFEFSRAQLKNADTQTRLAGLLSRNAIESGTVRETIAAMLQDQQVQQQRVREEEEKRRALISQREALREQLRTLDAELAGSAPAGSDNVWGADPESGIGGKKSVKWSREYGSQVTVCAWICDILERLAPAGSTTLIYHDQLTDELCAFLNGRGTQHAQSLTQEQRKKVAGNMIDWITAEWTRHLGGKDSYQMSVDPGATVVESESKPPMWLMDFTRVWTRRRMNNKYAFRRR